MSEFFISTENCKLDIGAIEFERLQSLCEWIYGTPEIEKIRAAPSPITRSEAELSCLSSPRFSYRVYLRADSFVNARRLELFRQSFLNRLDVTSASADYSEITTTLATSTCIGDALLVPPERLSDFHILTAELGLAYGEHRRIDGTPFVAHIELLGGGLCAQAVCFICTSLWEDETEGIHAVAEITALSEPPDAELLNLSGMTTEKLIHYFQHESVKLGATLQHVSSGYSKQRRLREFSDALFAYVSSGIPIILPVDVGRLNGIECENCVFESNTLPPWIRERWKESSRERPHAVVIVGTAIEPAKRRQDQEFIINDPASFPFLKASAEQLADARRYNIGGSSRNELGRESFIPITPDAVKLCLLDQDGIVPPHHRPGLCQLAFQLQVYARNPNLPAFDDPNGYDAGRFRLFDFSRDPDASKRLNGAPGDIPGHAINHLWSMVKGGHIPAQWCWVQHKSHPHSGTADLESLWVWDAQKEVPLQIEGLDETDLWKYSLAVMKRERGKWSSPIRHRANLRPALMTSFTLGGFREAFLNWPPAIDKTDVACEFYLAMQGDADRLKSSEDASTLKTAVEIMAEAAGNAKIVTTLADELSTPSGPRICGLATFIPEIAAREDSARGYAAQKAIQFVSEVAIALKLRDHPIASIELVGGSRIDEVFRMRPLSGGPASFCARKMTDGEVRRRILANLRQSVRNLRKSLVDNNIAFALELEPGPLFAIRNWTTLRDFCTQINGDDFLGPLIGVNLDLAHWRLAGLNIAQLSSESGAIVRQRIVHAHISGHHRRGHLGDIHLQDFQQVKEFEPWFEFLRDVLNERRNENQPSYGGFVAHEFEAARSSQDVLDSVKSLVQLCKGKS